MGKMVELAAVITGSKYLSSTTKVTKHCASLAKPGNQRACVFNMADHRSMPNLDDIKVKVIGEVEGRYDLNRLPKLKRSKQKRCGKRTKKSTSATPLVHEGLRDEDDENNEHQDDENPDVSIYIRHTRLVTCC